MKKVLDINNNFFRLNTVKLNNTEVMVGYDNDRKPIVIDFAKCDNLLITGPSESGKSNLVCEIVETLIDKNSLKDLDIYAMQIIGEDVNEFIDFEHCVEFVFQDPLMDKVEILEKMVSCIEEIERKVKRRISIFSDMAAEFKNLYPFELDNIINQFPLTVVVIEDFSYLISDVYFESVLEKKLQVAFLESLDRILKLNKDLKICVIQVETSSNRLLENNEDHNKRGCLWNNSFKTKIINERKE